MHYQPFPKDLVGAGKPSPLLSQESHMTTGSLDDFLVLFNTQETSSGSTLTQTKSQVPQELVMNSSSSSSSSSSSDDEDWLLEEETSSDESNADHTETSADHDESLSSEEMQLLVDELVEQQQETNFEPLFPFHDLYAMDWDKTETTSITADMEPIPFAIESSTQPPQPSVSKPKNVKAAQLPFNKIQSNKPKAIKARPTVKKAKKVKQQTFSEPSTLVMPSPQVVQQEQRNKKRVRKVYDAPFGRREYFELTALDVGLGRGGEMNRHEGNLRFHDAKRALQPHYKACFKDSRTDIAQALVDQVHQWGGRFLKKDQKGYYEVHNHTARTKCSQALRETYTQEERAAKREKHRQLKKLKQQ